MAKPNNLFPKNLDLYWLAASGLLFWFLFIHAPPILLRRKVWSDPPFLLHLIGCYGICLACMHNSLFTPGCANGNARPFHVWFGRVGLILGVIAFVFGAYLTWTRVGGSALGFSIFITAGGVLQIYAQYRGYRAIREYKKLDQEMRRADTGTTGEAHDGDDSSTVNHVVVEAAAHVSPSVALEMATSRRLEKDKALQTHILWMLVLFVVACGMPAVVRVMGNNGSMLAMFAAVGLLNILTVLYQKSFVARLIIKAPPPSGVVVDAATAPANSTTPLVTVRA